MLNVVPQILSANLGKTITSIFEIGSRDADDAILLSNMLGVPHSAVTIFEPHPDLCSQIRYTKPTIRAEQLACSNVDGLLPFYSCIISNQSNWGMSSLVPREDYNDTSKYKKIDVKVIRMDNWMKENEINEIGFLKLDVEGNTWEALEGFGNRLKDIKVIHLEAERKHCWNNQHLFSEVIEKLLPTHDLVFCYDQGGQSDSIWIEKTSTK